MADNIKQNPFEYKPEAGDAKPRVGGPRFSSVSAGYHDYNGLRKRLNSLIKKTDKIISVSEAAISGTYSLKIPEGSRLEKAQAQEWENVMGTSSVPKDSVTYEEYKSLKEFDTRSSDYITKQYEKYMRGPAGSLSIDVILASKVINKEAKNILEFLDNYIGSVTHTSEYRTLEILQDWTKDAEAFASQLSSLSEKGIKKQYTQTIPESELGQVTRSDAVQFQTLFKTKINSYNEIIDQEIQGLDKVANNYSRVFYNRFLGPTLKFTLNVTRGLTEKGTAPTFLGHQARKGEASFDWQMEEKLTDMLKRNEQFRASMQGVMMAIDKRNDYNGYIRQLAPYGTPVGDVFTASDLSISERDQFDSIARSYVESTINPLDTEFLSDHNVLDGRMDDDAHPQYLLKSGGTITGNILVDEGVKIDNVDLDEHTHDGGDTPKISATNLELGTLVTSAIDTSQPPPTPTNLRIKSVQHEIIPPGQTVIDVIMAWDGNPGYLYEVQVTDPNDV